MPEVDFNSVPDSAGYGVLPQNKYLREITKVEVKTTQAGAEYWNLYEKVISGDHVGRFIFDKLYFHTPGALKRTKFVLHRVGIDTSVKRNFKPEELEGKKAYGMVLCAKKYNEKTGVDEDVNIVPYNGYEHIEGTETAEVVPF